MRIQGFRILFIISIASFLISCSKSSDTVNRSTRLSLLQQTWTSRTTKFHATPDGPPLMFIIYGSTLTYTFGTNFRFYLADPPIPSYYQGIPYTLLADDSTLIFTKFDSAQNIIGYDTNYISLVTEHQLIYHGFSDVFNMISRDTLRR